MDDGLTCGGIYRGGRVHAFLCGECRGANEFWVSLIEKAYTKLYGSHSSKARGFFDDSLVDLTGLTSKKIVIDSDKMKNKN